MRNIGKIVAAIIIVIVISFTFQVIGNKVTNAQDKNIKIKQLEIEVLKSKSGIPIWLVREKNSQIFHLHLAWRAGAAHETKEINGISNFIAHLLDEGAGELDSIQFQQKLDDHAIQLGFNAGRDYIYTSLKTLSKYKETALKLLKLSLNQPRFEQEAIDRVRLYLIDEIKEEMQSPQNTAIQNLLKLYFNNHPYSQKPNGTIDNIKNINRSQLQQYFEKIKGKNTVRVVVVGDVDKEYIVKYIDELFEKWPQQNQLQKIQPLENLPEKKYVLEKRNTPQTFISFAKKGLKINDPDYLNMKVMSYILGEGSFSSRLLSEIREKRGLTYGISSFNRPYQNAAIYVGTTTTSNEKVIILIKELLRQFRLISQKGVTKDELLDAKAHLIGAYMLRFTSGEDIAYNLLSLANNDIDKEYVYKRNQLIEKISLEDVNEIAKKLIKSDEFVFSFAGNLDEKEIEEFFAQN